MEKRIELEKRARKADQITSLNLDNCRSTSIVGLTDEYTALESLSLINVGLTTLKGFPKLPNLKKLELSDNRISNGLNYLTTSPKLQSLNLSGNKIKDLETLKPLEEFKNLADLDLFNNEATQIDNYRDKIFKMLPSLKFLDGFDCNDVEAPSEGEDDDEVNGNDSDEDKQNVFCLNGLEIDLDELEEFEKRVKAKKKAAETNNSMGRTSDEIDDLDEYLNELKLKEDLKESTNYTTTSDNGALLTSIDGCSTTFSESTTLSTARNPISYAILLYWFLAILNLANAAYFSNASSSNAASSSVSNAASDSKSVDSGEEDSFDDEDNGDVSLAEVYNDDLEEDNSEWDEEDNGEFDEDDDSDEEEPEGDGEANESATKAEKKDGEVAVGEEEPQARGKKRKHDG